MSSSDDKSAEEGLAQQYARIIPRENAGSFQSWELPEVDGDDAAQEETMPMLTAEEIERIQQQAYEEGYEHGKRQGLKDGFEQGEAEGKKQGHQQAFEASLKDFQQQAFHFEQIYRALQEPLELVDQQIQYELAHLAVAVARQVIQDELKTRPELILPLVEQCLKLLPSASKTVRIHLHPLDAVMVKETLDTLEEHVCCEIQLLENAQLKRGGCLVETDISHIDASIDHRIEEIAKKIIPPEPVQTDPEAQTVSSDNPPEAEQLSEQNAATPQEDSQAAEAETVSGSEAAQAQGNAAS